MRARSTLIFSGTSLLAFPQTSAWAAPAAPVPPGCSVATTYVEGLISTAKGHPIVFSREARPFQANPGDGRWQQSQGSGLALPPPAELIRHFRQQAIVNAVGNCRSVRSLLTTRRIPFGEKAVDTVSTRDPSKRFKATVFTISVAVISEDGKMAILSSSEVSGLMAGGAHLYFLQKRANGKWKVVASSLLTVA